MPAFVAGILVLAAADSPVAKLSRRDRCSGQALSRGSSLRRDAVHLCSDFRVTSALRSRSTRWKSKRTVEFLRNDSQARKAFIEKIAAPVLNKMFECGMIP